MGTEPAWDGDENDQGTQMTTYAAISDASDSVVDLLRTQVGRRDDVVNIAPAEIVLASPDDIEDSADARLSVFPYKLSRDSQNANPGRRKTGTNTYQNPPLVVTVNYLITAYPPGSVDGTGQQLQQQQSALGLAMQVFHDHAVVDDHEDAASLQLSLATTANDEIEAVWNASLDGPLQPSVIYEAGPIVIESTRSQDLSHVTQRDIDMDRTNHRSEQR